MPTVTLICGDLFFMKNTRTYLTAFVKRVFLPHQIGDWNMTCYVISDPEILKNLDMRDPREAFVSVTSPTAFGCEEEIARFIDTNARMIESVMFSEPQQHVEPKGSCWYCAGKVTYKLRRIA